MSVLQPQYLTASYAAVQEMYEVLTSDLQLSGPGLLEVRKPCHFGHAFQCISPMISRHLKPVSRQLNVMYNRLQSRFPDDIDTFRPLKLIRDIRVVLENVELRSGVTTVNVTAYRSVFILIHDERDVIRA